MENNSEDPRAYPDRSLLVSDMSRRSAIRAIAGAVGAIALGSTAAETAVPADALRTFEIGEFQVDVSRKQISVRHKGAPDRSLWQSTASQPFLAIGIGNAAFREHGNPLGSFDTTDAISSRYLFSDIDTVAPIGASSIAVHGTLAAANSTIGFRIAFNAVSENQLQFVITPEGDGADRYNRIFLNYASSADEAFFGFGQQLTYFNQKGNVIPIVVQEHGIGRGLPIVTQLVDLLYDGAGGNSFITEAPVPQYITSQLRSLFLENNEYGIFDMRAADHVAVKLFSGTMTGRIIFGSTPLDLIQEYTSYCGRVRALPAWAHEGVIVATEGGSGAVNALLTKLTDAGVPLVGLWIQDWSGTKSTPAGHQVLWNWQLSSELYPDWDQIVEKLAGLGARMFIYINPFLVPVSCDSARRDDCPRDLYQEALSKGYLVKQHGQVFTYINSSIRAGMLDLSNPDARLWIKQVIKEEMIGKARASGWMGDFGEALPFDADLHQGADPHFWHNHYPEAWARVQREAIDETGRGEDFMFWNRSGFSRSPTYSTAGWLGDQLQTWDEFDGIKTAVVGLLSGGISGFSILHSDTGGFIAAELKDYPVIARSKELLMRWMELNAFTALFRTHEGLIPSISAQVDTDIETLSHLARFALVYKSLAFYRKMLVDEASKLGLPVVRHLFLHYPDDPNVHELRYQYLLGPEFLIAPVLDEGADFVNVYFPAGNWVHLWSGANYSSSGKPIQISAPLGQPGVFFKQGSDAGAELVRKLRELKIL
jgi:alpha-glucosidase (family GH31 glycosyl hydrolase)